MGNLRSVVKAFEFLGVPVRVSGDLSAVEKLVIPGVGAFGAAMERLGPLSNRIRGLAEDGVAILGICLGQQLLMDESEELGSFAGLGLIPGRVRYLPRDLGLKVPHIGWSPIRPVAEARLFAETRDDSEVYFVHSLVTELADSRDLAAQATYGGPFAAAVERDRVFGVQFHPEKSGAVGLTILRRFAEC